MSLDQINGLTILIREVTLSRARLPALSNRDIIMNGSEEDSNLSIRADLLRIRNFLESPREDSDEYIELGQAIILQLNSVTFFEYFTQNNEQVWVIETLQLLAYFDVDSGGAQDIAEWCVNRWLQLLQHSPQTVAVLQGLGQSWLFRAQRALSRIHQDEDSSHSSGTSSGPSGTGSLRYSSSDEARDAARATLEADARLHSPEYVEARGFLLPSTDYLQQAVHIAESTGELNGSLLTLAAEAFMSLGNVSYSAVNEGYFRQALDYLRRASQLPGYSLSPHFQNYLDEYGRFQNQ